MHEIEENLVSNESCVSGQEFKWKLLQEVLDMDGDQGFSEEEEFLEGMGDGDDEAGEEEEEDEEEPVRWGAGPKFIKLVLGI